MAEPTKALTRLGRAIARHHLWVLFLLVLLGGAFGFYREGGGGWPPHPATLSDALYRSLQMFGLNFDLPVAADQQVGWLLHVCRVLAVAISAYTVLALFFVSALDEAKLWLQVRMRKADRHVLLGFGQVNRATAAELRSRGIAVTAIDRSLGEADRRLARELGVLLIEGDVTDDQVLHRAGLDRARRVIVAVGDDMLGIEVAARSAPMVEAGLVRRHGKARPPGQTPWGEYTLRVHLSDLALSQDMVEARDLSQARARAFLPFNLRQEAARELVTRARLTRKARDRGQAEVHLVIVGLGDLGQSVLLEAMMQSYCPGLGRPRITVLDCDGDAATGRLKARFSRLMEGRFLTLESGDGPGVENARRTSEDLSQVIAPIEVHQFDLVRVAFDADPLLDALVDGSTDPRRGPTAWVFACGSEVLNQAAAHRLEIAMQARARTPAPIYVRQWGSDIHGEDRDPLGLVVPFADVRTTLRHSSVLDAGADELARRVHAAYMAADRGEDGPRPREEVAFTQDWIDLPEAVREANRRVVRGLRFRLADLGFALPATGTAAIPPLDPEAAGWLAARIRRHLCIARRRKWSRLGLTPQLRAAAVAEHCSWMVERAARGWHQAPAEAPRRDNALRRQANMKLFRALAPEVQAFDVLALLAVLEAAVEDGATEGAGARPKGQAGRAPPSPSAAAHQAAAAAGTASRLSCPKTGTPRPGSGIAGKASVTRTPAAALAAKPHPGPVGAPLNPHGLRRHRSFAIGDGLPLASDLDGLSEVELCHDGAVAGGSHGARALRGLLGEWSRTPAATRLHLRLARPVMMPTVYLTSLEFPAQTDPILQLVTALSDLDPRVVCDVTRHYGRVDIPGAGLRRSRTPASTESRA